MREKESGYLLAESSGEVVGSRCRMSQSPFRYFKTSREVIQLAVMMYVRFPASLRIVEDLLHESGIYGYHESVQFWVDRFGPTFVK